LPKEGEGGKKKDFVPKEGGGLNMEKFLEHP